MDGQFLREYIRALVRAIWSGFGITDTLVIVIILVLTIIDFLLGTHYEHPSGAVIATLAVLFILFELFRTSFQLYAGERAGREHLQNQPRPQLNLEAPHVAQTYIALARDRSQSPATYVRVPVRNISSGTAHRCAAKLLKIEFLDREGWRQLPYNDTLDMAWSNKKPVTNEIDIAPDGLDLLDIVYAVEGSRELRLATIVRPNYPGLLSLAGDYQFTFQLTSADAGLQTCRLRIHWGFDRMALGFPADPIDKA